MLIVKIKAGLGNQMFQYAFGRALSLERKEPLFLDTFYYKNQPERDAKREYILDKFNIEANYASEEMYKKYNSKLEVFFRKLYRRIKKVEEYTYYPSFMKSKASYFEGYWANQKYFLKYENIIRKELSLKNPFGDSAKKIDIQMSDCLSKGEIPVSIHIRRGDFVSNPHSAAYNGLLGIPHYEKAVELLMSKYFKNISVFIFSDDIAWVKENLKLPCPMYFVSNSDIKDYEEIILMSECKHHVLANSTFSWWGAWLNPNHDKIVIVPKQWIAKKTTEEIDLIPKEWITI
ncbi:MAG: alpha-1,2-fucosyltransferase [Minisyncoccia bacterium]